MEIMEREKTLEKLKQLYKNTVANEYELAKIISDLEKYINYEISTGLKGTTKVVEEKYYTKITYNKMPEKVELVKENRNDYYKSAYNYWVNSTIYALQNANIPKLTNDRDKYLVIINLNNKIYNTNIWDIDNYNISFLINGIRYASKIKNDTFKDISYMVTGKENEQLITEVYITTIYKYPLIINEFALSNI